MKLALLAASANARSPRKWARIRGSRTAMRPGTRFGARRCEAGGERARRNAVLHPECAPDELIEVRVRLGQDHLLIAVHDLGDHHQTPEPKRKAESAHGGFGLRIVEQIARRWGAERPDGHLVWAEAAM
jgi:hypothetical protein